MNSESPRTELPDEVQRVLFDVADRLGFYPDSGPGSEPFFNRLADGYGERAAVDAAAAREWLEEQLEKGFRVLRERPRWIQSPDWQFWKGEPMVFVGQLDIPAGTTRLFHDDAAFFVFWSPEEGVTETIIQVA
jgi:hypothetical protein